MPGRTPTEAQSAESRADFIHKLEVAGKEAQETKYCLLLCNESHRYPHHTKPFFLLEEIMKLLNAIIKSSKQSLQKAAG